MLITRFLESSKNRGDTIPFEFLFVETIIIVILQFTFKIIFSFKLTWAFFRKSRRISYDPDKNFIQRWNTFAKNCILKVHLFPGLHSFDEYSNNTSKELLEQFSGWEEEERGYLTFVKKEVSLFPRDLKNRIGAPLAESLVVEKMQAANYTSRYAFYRPVYRICSIKPLIPRALTDTGFYYVALATKSYKGLCSRSPVGATASFHGVITRTAFSGIHPPPPPLLVLSLFSSSIVVK